jgi:c-di-GMP-binding flagellar brake protein YcgR
MNWNEAISRKIITTQTSCQLIVVGQTQNGVPFCFEDSFAVQNVQLNQISGALVTATKKNPFTELNKVTFIELSFREKGGVYLAYVELLNIEIKSNLIVLTLTSPTILQCIQNRKYNRINLRDNIQLSCNIIGLRRQKIQRSTTFSTRIVDLSASGLSFISTVKLFYPLFLEFSFSLLDESQLVTVCGEIVRVTNVNGDSYRIACEFRDAPVEAISIINRYCCPE